MNGYTIDFSKYSLGDIVSLADPKNGRIITYGECSDILEDEIQERYPAWKGTLEVLVPHIRQNKTDEQYCLKLIEDEELFRQVDERARGPTYRDVA
jgi:hypothetical protein